MDEYPSNSHNNNPNINKKEESKKIERVVEGVVVRRKKSMVKRTKDIFLGGDPKTALAYVALVVLVPAAKNMIADAGNTFFERMLFGESHSGNRRTISRKGSPLGHINYGGNVNRYTPSSLIGRDEPRNVSRKARASHNFDEIIIETRVEANEVIDSLLDVIEKYRSVSVADLYEMINVSSDYTDRKWGWTDLSGAMVTNVRGGYLLNLPKPEPLD